MLIGRALTLALCLALAAQGGGHALFGDLTAEEAADEGAKLVAFVVVLYTEDGVVVGRQSVSNGGRYRFLNLSNGIYSLAVEVEGAEVARLRVEVQSPFKNDFRQDIQLESRAPRPASGKPAAVAAAEVYERTPANRKLYARADELMRARKYAEAASLLRQLVNSDPRDYQATTELGTALLFQEQAAEAERAYLRAAELKPDFALAHLNLGRLRMARKDYDGAVAALTKAVALRPPSAAANFLLGEAYLQLRKGSKAVPYLEEAARLGRDDAHLRLATLYHAVGLKDRAAEEYARLLARHPDHPDRERLRRYIEQHKKRP